MNIENIEITLKKKVEIFNNNGQNHKNLDLK